MSQIDSTTIAHFRALPQTCWSVNKFRHGKASRVRPTFIIGWGGLIIERSELLWA